MSKKSRLFILTCILLLSFFTFHVSAQSSEWIVYSALQGGNRDLFLIDPNGIRENRLTNDEAEQRQPVLNAIGRNEDGRWIQVSGYVDGWVNRTYVDTSNTILALPVTFYEIGEWSRAGQPTGVRAQVLAFALRIRGCPSTDCRQLEGPDILEEGDAVDIVGRSNDGEWYQVNVLREDGRLAAGWISADFVRLTGNTQAFVPITD